MRKIIGYFLCVLVGVVFYLTTPVAADIMVVDIDPPDADTNPQWVTPSNPADEEEWLEGLLGLTYNDPTVEFISKDEDSNPLDNVPSNWLYAVLKYGVGQPSVDNPDHWAIMDDGDFTLDLGDISGLPALDSLSHVSYFDSTPIPEPATILLLGSGLIGLASFRRRKLKK